MGDHIESVRTALSKLKIKNIQVVSDGSLSDSRHMFGVEIKVLFKLDDTTNLKQVCDFLAKYNAEVDSSCGLHVHIDSRHLKGREAQENMAKKYADAMKILSLMLPKERRNARYCKDGYSFSQRYHAVNACSLEKHGSIEIRSHSGTTNYTKILNWVKLLSLVSNVQYVRRGMNANKFFQGLGANKALTDYAMSRIAKFTPENAEDDNEETLAYEDRIV